MESEKWNSYKQSRIAVARVWEEDDSFDVGQRYKVSVMQDD